MNIFVLDTSPEIAASYHCDQHLHKMILESAQMLSTAAHVWFPSLKPHIYKPAYENHPCTKWVRADQGNALWLCTLAKELEAIRFSLNCPTHSASSVIDAITSYLDDPDNNTSTPFIFAGDPVISIRPSLPSVPDKYKEYYRQKHKRWVLDKGRGMTYKNRPIPAFMSDLLTSST